MSFQWSPREHWALGRFAVRWILITLPVGLLVGSACAAFLWLLDQVTRVRFDHPSLLYLLPVAGVVIAWMYGKLGGKADGGNNLIIDAIHGPRKGDGAIVVPRRMAPLILVSTLITHLFGGSAGREGTAVQMGGSIASGLGRLLRLAPSERRFYLMAGVAAGFGGVFGTPIAGAVFALEVLAIGRMSYDALLPCVVASVVAAWTCDAWGIHHTHYAIATVAPSFDWLLIGKVAGAGIAFGLVSMLFAELTHGFGSTMRRMIRSPYFRPVVGGILVIGLAHLAGTRDYLGIGVRPQHPDGIGITTAFFPDGADPFSWLKKLVFTAVTLGSGFKGGEVTPLFFVGSTLGNTLGGLLNAPIDLFAGLGFLAVFAGATNTPLACTLMGIELFGADYALYFLVATSIAYLSSGHSGIYLSQRIARAKGGTVDLERVPDLRTARELRSGWSLFRRKKES